MPKQYRNAAVRVVIATGLVVVWVLWYDGPPWAWALLAVYVVVTFGMAALISKKVARMSEDRADDT